MYRTFLIYSVVIGHLNESYSLAKLTLAVGLT